MADLGSRKPKGVGFVVSLKLPRCVWSSLPLPSGRGQCLVSTLSSRTDNGKGVCVCGGGEEGKERERDKLIERQRYRGRERVGETQ